MPPDVNAVDEPDLPELDSPGCEKTYRLIDVTAPLAERLVRLARLPVLRSMTRRLLAVLDEVLG